jgi:hypothetical protein
MELYPNLDSGTRTAMARSRSCDDPLVMCSYWESLVAGRFKLLLHSFSSRFMRHACILKRARKQKLAPRRRSRGRARIDPFTTSSMTEDTCLHPRSYYFDTKGPRSPSQTMTACLPDLDLHQQCHKGKDEADVGPVFRLCRALLHPSSRSSTT